MEFEIKSMQPEERLYVYQQSRQLQAQTGSIGYLRGDFGKSGTEFYTSWQDHIKTFRCLLYTSPSPRDYAASRMPSSA